MEDIGVTTHGANLLIVDSEPIILNNINNFKTFNDNFFRTPFLETLNAAPTFNVDTAVEAPKDTDRSCLILGNELKLDNANVIRLSVEDLQKLGIQLSVDNQCSNRVEVNDNIEHQYIVSSAPELKSNIFLSDSILNTNVESPVPISLAQTINVATIGPVLSDDTLKKLSLQEYQLITSEKSDSLNYAVPLTNASSSLSNEAPSLPEVSPQIVSDSGTITLSELLKNCAYNTSPATTDVSQNNMKAPKTWFLNLASPEDIDQKNKNLQKMKSNEIRLETLLSSSNLPKVKGQPLLVKNKRIFPAKNENVNQKKISVLNKAACQNKSLLTPKGSTLSLLKPLNFQDVNDPNMGNKMFANICKINVPNTKEIDATEKKQQTPGVLNIAISDSRPQKPARRLTQSQLNQIATVLQKNRNNEETLKTPSTLYDTETNTRIICRVIYPEDVEDEKKTAVKKVVKTSKPKEFKEDKFNDFKYETTKIIARTRSGRLSRPPKRIISSSNELENLIEPEAPKPEEPPPPPPEPPVKDSKNRCPTCQKMYIGLRLAKHFAKNPDHCDETTLKNIFQQHGADLLNNSAKPKPPDARKCVTSFRKRMKFKNGGKVPPLSDLLECYSTSDVVKAAGSKVASSLSLWELLLLKVNSQEGNNKVEMLCSELLNLTSQVQHAAHSFLSPSSSCSSDVSQYVLEDDTLSTILHKRKGFYECKDGMLSSMLEELHKKSEETSGPEAKKPKLDIPSDLTSNPAPILDCSGLLHTPDQSENQLKVNSPSVLGCPGNSIIMPEDNKTIDLGDSIGDIKMQDQKNESLELDLCANVDELVNERFDRLAGDIVPSLPSKAFADDILQGILSDSQSGTGSLSSSVDVLQDICNVRHSSSQSLNVNPSPERNHSSVLRGIHDSSANVLRHMLSHSEHSQSSAKDPKTSLFQNILSNNQRPPSPIPSSSTITLASILSHQLPPPSSSVEDDIFPLDKSVSASTEDLIKSLENLSQMPNQPSLAPIDFGDLSQDFPQGSLF